MIGLSNISDTSLDSISERDSLAIDFTISDLKRPFKRNRKRELLNTRLLDAVRSADIKECRRLIDDEGADVNATCHDTGVTALIVSAAWGHVDVVILLLKNEANPLIRDNKGRTAAHIAAALGNYEALCVMLESKYIDQLINARVNDSKCVVNYNELFDSWLHQHNELLPDIPELNQGSTPLHVACKTSNSNCVDVLLQEGADAGILDSRGLSAIDVLGETVHRLDNSLSGEDDSGASYGFCIGPLPVCKFPFPSPSKYEHNKNISTSRYIFDTIINYQSTAALEDTDKLLGKAVEGDETDDQAQPDIQEFRYQLTMDFGKKDSNKSKSKPAASDSALKYHIVPGIKECCHDVLATRDRESYEIFFNEIRRYLRKNCLHTAVKERDKKFIKRLLKKRMEYFFQTDENGCTPAHLSVENKDVEILMLLLTECSYTDVQDSKGRTLLYRSVELEWIEGIDLILNACVHIKTPADDGSTVLHVAARKNNPLILKELLDCYYAKEMIDARDNKGYPPIFSAVSESSASCLYQLLIHDAHTNIVLEDHTTVLLLAAQKGSEEILKILLKIDAKHLNYLEGYHGSTPLLEACMAGNANCVSLLIEYYTKNWERFESSNKLFNMHQPLSAAILYDHLSIADVLIRYDKDAINTRDHMEHLKPLQLAAKLGKEEFVKLFLKAGDNLASPVSRFCSCCDQLTTLDMVSLLPRSEIILKEIFNSFIKTNDYPPGHEDSIITFKYDLLSPPSQKDSRQMRVLDAITKTRKTILQEVLLLHPLSQTFILLKWKKFRIFFILIFTIYCILTLSVTIMSLVLCHEMLSYFLPNDVFLYRITNVLAIVLLAILEFFEMITLRIHYIFELESWIRWIIFVMAGFLSLSVNPTNDSGSPVCFHNMASVTILLCWIELLLISSRIPDWGFNVLVFCKVTKNVLVVLATFSILFLAYTFSLVIEFRSVSSFQNIWQSFVKVVTMTYDLEFGEMFSNITNIQEHSEHEQYSERADLYWELTGKFILLSFIVINIGLLNLIIGVSVNDVTSLEQHGKAQHLVKQISFLCLVETVIYDNFLVDLLPDCIKRKLLKAIDVPPVLTWNTGNSENHNTKIFPSSLRNAVFDRINSMKKLHNQTDESVSQKMGFCLSSCMLSKLEEVELRLEQLTAKFQQMKSIVESQVSQQSSK